MPFEVVYRTRRGDPPDLILSRKPTGSQAQALDSLVESGDVIVEYNQFFGQLKVWIVRTELRWRPR